MLDFVLGGRGGEGHRRVLKQMRNLASSGWGGVGLETRVRGLLHQSWRTRWRRTDRQGQPVLMAYSVPGLGETPSGGEKEYKKKKEYKNIHGIEFPGAEVCTL